jgi:type IV pilus assembly protein PilY1
MRESIFRFHVRSRWGGALCASFWGLTTLLVAESANAQLGTANVPLPNVLLLQDTSGSFEYMIDGNLPEVAGEGGTCCVGQPVSATCPQGSSTPTNPNRWGVAVQALTGNILPSYACAAMDRTQPGFYNQYAISTGTGGVQAPYDYQYYLPFHRAASFDATTNLNCMYTPQALPGAVSGGGVGFPTPVATGTTDCAGVPCTAFGFPPDAIGTYGFQTTAPYGGAAPTTGQCAPAACAPASAQTANLAADLCTFSQAPNGALDGAGSLMRFGLMTFDNDPGEGIGVTASASAPVPANTAASAFSGQWSYYSGWDLGASGDTGYPAGCTITPAPFFEVGARNPAAPPWEGRLVTFPSPSADTTATIENNQLVQLAIAAMRPYGATPLSGMFDDAEEYLWHDPTGPQQTDAFVQGGCRAEYIIVLTDGQPNEDLGVTPGIESGSCLGTAGSPPTAGKCPYQSASQAAAALFAGSDAVTGRAGQKVTTYVIGFAVSQNITTSTGSTIASCSQLASTSGGFATYCPTATPSSPQYPCCVLQEIAAAGQGGTGQAYFADTPGDLNAALGAILGQIAKQLSSKTLPVYSPAVSYNTGTGTGQTSMYLTSFSGATVPWAGDVQREEIICQGNPLAPVTQPLNPIVGDDFLIDLQHAVPTTRNFITYQLPTPGTGASATIRPFLTSPTDGIGAFGQAGVEVGLAPSNLTGMPNLATMFSTTTSSCQNPVTHLFSIPAAGCADVALQFAMAQPTVTTGDTSTPSFDTIYAGTGPTAGTTRCPGAGTSCNPLGAVLHSTPAFTTPPNALLQDDTYQAFATALSPTVLSPPRLPTLYVATTDGLLHAFNTTVTTETNNELWSFIPPGVFPNLLSNYPSASSVLLDGAPIVKDVVWERDLGGTSAAWTAAWHTMLIAGFGAGGRGYYALDVTDPRSGSNYSPVSNYTSFPPALTGPHFQWQIASMNIPNGPANQSELFGTISATPAITTVFTDPTSGGTNPREIGVAILPGGGSGTPFPGLPCTREIVAHSGTYTPVTSYDDHDPLFPYRTQVRAWAANCTGPGSGVPGRSVTVVRIDTGDILAVFARPSTSSPDVPSTLLPAKFIAAPFDSPMTGTPIVYPSDVGAIAQQVFIGDADGTLWRLDLTEPNPANWRAALFSDGYNSVTDIYNLSDTNHLAYDSESISINPLTTLDQQGNLTVQFATGDQATYTASYTIPGQPTQVRTEVNFVYSVKVAGSTNPSAPGAIQAAVNWFLPMINGERVTGPMTVFNNILYFASFLPPNATSPSSPVCTGGTPMLWGLDFELPNPTCSVGPPDWQSIPTGCGGTPRDFLPTGWLANPPDANGNPTVNVVIPGVAVAVTPSCTNTSAATANQYTGGMQTGVTGTTSGTYSLVAQIGGKNNTTNSTNTISRALTAPNAPTLVDSWATLSE